MKAARALARWLGPAPALPRRPQRLSAATVMGLAFTVPAGLIAALLVGDHYLLARRYLAQEGTRCGEILGAPILDAAPRFLREGQVGAVQEMIAAAGSHPDVRAIALVGGDGLVLASTEPRWIGRPDSVIEEPAYHEAKARARAAMRPEHLSVDRDRRVVLVSPLPSRAPGASIAADAGVLYIGIDHEERMRAATTAILARGAVSGLGLVAVSLFLLLWVHRSLTRPILKVAAHVRAIPSGAVRPPLRPAGPREVAGLVEDVGRMSRELDAKAEALRASEENLRQSQRMEGVASLAGAMAHDFNNLLTGILGYARLLLDRVGPRDPIRRELAAIETSAMRAADLTARLLTFSRRAATRPEAVDLGRALQGALEDLHAALPQGVEFIVEIPASVWTTEVDVPQIRRVVEALCANAREAMPYGGRLTVSLANRSLDDGECRGRAEARPGRFVVLTVADTGRGFDPEVRRRLFEPFVTTKQGGSPRGFGLAAAYGLVKGHDGWIEVAGEPGNGASVSVWLPVSDTPAAAPAPAPGPSQSSAAAGVDAAPTILAVDDEPTILALIRDVLELGGYRVLTARNGEEALRLYAAHGAGIDLVLLDLTMPVMNGLECFRRLRSVNPAVRVIISSGFSSESGAAEVLREGALEFLSKPYDIQTLARVVASALGGAADGAGRAPGRAAASG